MDRDYTKEQGSLTAKISQGPLIAAQEGEGIFQSLFVLGATFSSCVII